MTVFEQLSALQHYLKPFHINNTSIGFVPTMGALHEGHLSLIKHAKQHCDKVVVSIFVNPTQFGPHEDFDQYPRTIDADLTLCKQHGVDAVFCPTASTIYPNDTQTTITLPQLAPLYCGQRRPQFFNGVTNVVLRLFNIIQPTHAVFGTKDFQQLVIIKQMVADLFLPITILSAPIVRQSNGLALSSRNRYLTDQQIQQASSIYKSLVKAQDFAVKHPNHSTQSLIDYMVTFIDPAITIDYVAVVNKQSLQPETVISPGQQLLVAGVLGSTRLIDNISL